MRVVTEPGVLRSFFVTRSKRGMALLVTVSIFVVVSIILASLAFVFQNNLSQASNQEERMKAYYLALAGIELGYSALIHNTNTDPNADPVYYYAQVLQTTSTPPLTQEITLDGGEVAIVARRLEDKGDAWIEIRATGRTTKDVIRTSTMRFRVDNPAVLVRENG